MQPQDPTQPQQQPDQTPPPSPFSPDQNVFPQQNNQPQNTPDQPTPWQPVASDFSQQPEQPQPFGQQPSPQTSQFQQPQQPMQPGGFPQPPQPPQPPSTPSPFSPPAQPQSGSFGGLTPPAPGGKNPKKLITLIIGLVIALVVLAGGFLLYRSLTTVERTDYEAAFERIESATDAYGEVTTTTINRSSTKSDIKDEVDRFKTSRQELNNEISELGSTKAIKYDDDLREAYDALLEKKKTFDTTYDTLQESYEYILPILYDFGDIGSNSTPSTMSNAIRSIKNDFKGLTDLQAERNKEYVTKMIAIFEDLEQLTTQLQANPGSTVYSDFLDTLSELTDVTDEWTSGMTELEEESGFREELDKLADIYFDKISKLD